MIQKCSTFNVIEVFFIEPTTIHFIREISRKINLAPTSVRNIIKGLSKEGLVKKKDSKPFGGLAANRENEDFVFYKRIYNLFSLRELTNFLVAKHYPRLMAVYGSYSIGEDREDSDIDIFMLSKSKKEVNLEEYEKKLKRKVHLMVVDDIDKIDENLKKKILNGTVLHGGF